MKKMTKEAQMQTNGGKSEHIYHLAYCVKCETEFKATKFWQSVKYVKNLGYEHCMAKGGPSKGHRYIVLY